MKFHATNPSSKVLYLMYCIFGSSHAHFQPLNQLHIAHSIVPIQLVQMNLQHVEKFDAYSINIKIYVQTNVIERNFCNKQDRKHNNVSSFKRHLRKRKVVQINKEQVLGKNEIDFKHDEQLINPTMQLSPL